MAPTDPVHANVELTVRDERVMRVRARDHDGVEDGWLDDRTRFGYQAVHVDERIVEPLVREGTELMPASWEKALAAASGALKKAGARTAALADGETTNEEAFLLARLFRERLGSGNLASRPGGELPLDAARALADPALQATIEDLEFAHAVLLLECDPIDEAPTLDLRIRKGIRRHHVQLAVASARPTALDAQAASVMRLAPGGAEGLLVALDAALSGDDGNLGGASTAAGSNAQAVRDLGAWLRDVGDDLVIVYGDRALRGQGARALLNLAARLGLAGRDGAGLLEVPSVPNARGIREAGFAPGHGPGFSTVAAPGHDARAIAEGLASGELSTVWLHHADPVRFHPDRALWESALGTAQTVIAVETLLTDTVREYADVVFPGEAYPEKEGTLTNVDGRVQRLRAAIGRPTGRQRPAGQRRAPGVAGDRRRRQGSRARPRRADRGDGLQAAVRGRPVLRRADARRDRRPRHPLARAQRRVGRPERAGAALGAGRRRCPAGRDAAPRDLPQPVGGQGRRRLPRAALPAPAADRGAGAAGRRRARHPRRRPRRGRLRTAPASAGRSSCVRRCRPARCSWPRAWPSEPANLLTEPVVRVERVHERELEPQP